MELKNSKDKLENEVKEAQKRNAPLREKRDAVTKEVQLFEGNKKKKVGILCSIAV